MKVVPVSKAEATRIVVAHHYMHRAPPISFAFGLESDGTMKGIVTFGVPASRHMLIGACPSEPEAVCELNRLWCSDDMPRNSESWFLARALALLPPRIVLSYADTSAGHAGHVYRAANFFYAGWTDMDRKTPRFDYVTPAQKTGATDFFGYVAPDKHSRDAFRNGDRRFREKVRRLPKVRYWTVTGTRRDRRRLEPLCQWPKMSWKEAPPPTPSEVRP